MTENTFQDNADLELEPTLEHSTENLGADMHESAINQKKPKPRSKVKQSHATHVYDCIVIGAGISGIAAAYKMIQADYHDFVVLEKADQVGERGATTPIQAAAAMYLQRCIHFLLPPVINRIICLPSRQRF